MIEIIKEVTNYMEPIFILSDNNYNKMAENKDFQ